MEENEKKSVFGYVMDIQPFSVNDGDGIRTTIFLAGCPLRCQWCSNPEGFSCRELVGWHQRKCIGCGECANVCPEGIGIDLAKERFSDAPEDRCTACGKCVESCPVGARVFMVRRMEADDVLAKIQQHRLFYMQSGGGITFSGGEATSQPQFLRYLAEKIYDMGYDMAIETSGYFDLDAGAESDDLRWVLAHMDMIFMDLKIFDDDKHRRFTGVSNKKILENIEKLGTLSIKNDLSEIGQAISVSNAKGPRIVIRIPVIGGVNDDDDNIRRSAVFVHEKLPDAEMELLPYHEFGRIKYDAIGIPYPGDSARGFERPSKEKMEHLRSIVTEEGVKSADFR
jgi:pyruvate formate lyase activating enzyme